MQLVHAWLLTYVLPVNMFACLQVSWANGCKKAKLSGHAVKLPPLQAPDATGEAVPFWVKFTGNQKEWPGELISSAHSALAWHADFHATVSLRRLHDERHVLTWQCDAVMLVGFGTICI
eukprot:GHRR01030832.1.p1 GENE.GHRR01030832.1~~GHRR01030832.1.p1  ORF type:complete len:119 (-),score=13.65 GHRR01030832.1:266-622(-)